MSEVFLQRLHEPSEMKHFEYNYQILNRYTLQCINKYLQMKAMLR